MDKRFSVSALLSLFLHLAVFFLLSGYIFVPTGSEGAGEKIRLVGVVNLQQPEAKKQNQPGEEAESIIEPIRTSKTPKIKKPEKETDKASKTEPPKKETKPSPPGEKKQSTLGKKTASGRSDSGDARNEYLEKLMKKIESARRYPPLARRRGLEGTASLKLTVSRSGGLDYLKLIASSGHSVLDSEAENTINRATPLPPVPSELNSSGLTLIVPIKFKLN